MSDNPIKIEKPKIKVSELPKHPKYPEWGATESTAYSSKISPDRKGRSPTEIWLAEKEEHEERKRREKTREFLKRLAKRGHTSCFYQVNVGLNYEIPRHSTMFFCSFDHSKYLQQSQRYTKAKEFITMDNKDLKEIFEKQRSLYKDMIDSGIKKEDARYILPLGVAAKHLHQNTNFINLANILRVIESENSLVPSLTEEIFEDCLNSLEELQPDLFNRELLELYNKNKKGYPVANMFSKGNIAIKKLTNKLYKETDVVKSFEIDLDERILEKALKMNDEALSFLNLSSNLEKIRGYFAPMSLSAWHQFMRNDTVKNSVESVYEAIERSKFVVPPDIKKSNFEERFIDIFHDSIEAYNKSNGKYGANNALSVIPHALEINVAFNLDNFNIISGFLLDRAQKAAQWEIRGIAERIEEKI